MKKLSIIMPMYNTSNIVESVNSNLKYLNESKIPFEIILVNDGSNKECLREIKKINDERIKIVGYEINQGKGYAIKYGFKFATGDYIAFLDSDGDLKANQILNFLKIIDENDIVLGSKRHPKSVVRYPLARKIMSATYQFINKILFNLNLSDTQVGAKLFKRDVLNEIMPKILVKRFAFDLELLVIANKYNYRIVEAPIYMNYQFKSTINPISVFMILIDTLAIFYRDRILKHYG